MSGALIAHSHDADDVCDNGDEKHEGDDDMGNLMMVMMMMALHLSMSGALIAHSHGLGSHCSRL